MCGKHEHLPWAGLHTGIRVLATHGVQQAPGPPSQGLWVLTWRDLRERGGWSRPLTLLGSLPRSWACEQCSLLHPSFFTSVHGAPSFPRLPVTANCLINHVLSN